MNRRNIQDAGVSYQCPSCQVISTPKHGLVFFVIFFVFGAPVIEFVIRLATEGLLHTTFEGIQIYGWQLPRVLSFVVTFIIMLLVFLKLNRLISTEQNKGDATLLKNRNNKSP